MKSILPFAALLVTLAFGVAARADDGYYDWSQYSGATSLVGYFELSGSGGPDPMSSAVVGWNISDGQYDFTPSDSVLVDGDDTISWGYLPGIGMFLGPVIKGYQGDTLLEIEPLDKDPNINPLLFSASIGTVSIGGVTDTGYWPVGDQINVPVPGAVPDAANAGLLATLAMAAIVGFEADKRRRRRAI